MTSAQVKKFFKLARAAHLNVAPGQPFDGWRKAEMLKVVKTEHVHRVSPTWGYDNLMGHMAVLACDYGACAYFATSAERRAKWVLQGLCRDLEFLQMKGVPEAYVAEIHEQAGMQPRDYNDATLRDLMLLIPMLDTRIRKLAAENGLEPKNLPTAGKPWYFRGYRAALFQDYMDACQEAAQAKETIQQKEVAHPASIPA